MRDVFEHYQLFCLWQNAEARAERVRQFIEERGRERISFKVNHPDPLVVSAITSAAADARFADSMLDRAVVSAEDAAEANRRAFLENATAHYLADYGPPKEGA